MATQLMHTNISGERPAYQQSGSARQTLSMAMLAMINAPIGREGVGYLQKANLTTEIMHPGIGTTFQLDQFSAELAAPLELRGLVSFAQLPEVLL
jgi:hypothetical protein